MTGASVINASVEAFVHRHAGPIAASKASSSSPPAAKRLRPTRSDGGGRANRSSTLASRPSRRDRGSAGAPQDAFPAVGRAFTFEPHPLSFFFFSSNPRRRCSAPPTIVAKLRLLAATGLSGSIVLHFERALAGALRARLSVPAFLVARLRGLRRQSASILSASTVRALPAISLPRGRACGLPSTSVPRFEEPGGAGAFRSDPRGAGRVRPDAEANALLG